MKLNIKYENDRGTPCPERIKLKGETGPPGHPRLWWITVKNPTWPVKVWYKALPKKLSAPEVAIAMRELEGILGVTDPTDMDDWQKHGLEELNWANPGGFVNWPDPDLGKGWEGTEEVAA